MVLETNIERFISKVEMGRSFFEDAAVLLVKLIDEEPDVCERIIKLARVPWLTEDVLETFEMIGRKQLCVDAIFLPRHVLQRLIALPIEEQVKISTTMIPVVKHGSANRKPTDLKSAWKLSKIEAAVAIGPNGIRTPEQQNIVLKTKLPASALAASTKTKELLRIAIRKVQELSDHCETVRHDSGRRCANTALAALFNFQ